MTYPFDPELAAAVAMMAEVDITDLTAARAAQAAELKAALAEADERGTEISHTHAPGLNGGPAVPLRIYRPEAAPGALPALLSLHGGGFVLGSPDVDHDLNLRFCRELPAVVVAVDYRLAPEHPFPAALDDCYAALCWLAAHAPEVSADPRRIGLWGDSAGGGLAAGTALLARDRSGPAIRCQHLHSPALDDRLATGSARRYTDTPVWNRRNARLGWERYLGPGVPGSPGVSGYAAPARAADLTGLPPAFVAVMEFDPLHDEAVAFAGALTAAGVPTDLRRYPGTFHGAAAVTHSALAHRVTADALAALRGRLAR